MDFQRVINELFVVLTTFLVYAAVFTATHHCTIKETAVQNDLDSLAPNHRASWCTDYSDSQGSDEERSFQRSQIGLRPSSSGWRDLVTNRRRGFAHDRLEATELAEVVQRLSGSCIIEDFSSFGDDSHICYYFFSRATPFLRRRVSKCLARSHFNDDPLVWVAKLSNELVRSCGAGSEDVDGGLATTLSDEVTEQNCGFDTAFQLLVGIYALLLTLDLILILDCAMKNPLQTFTRAVMAFAVQEWSRLVRKVKLICFSLFHAVKEACKFMIVIVVRCVLFPAEKCLEVAQIFADNKLFHLVAELTLNSVKCSADVDETDIPKIHQKICFFHALLLNKTAQITFNNTARAPKAPLPSSRIKTKVSKKGNRLKTKLRCSVSQKTLTDDGSFSANSLQSEVQLNQSERISISSGSDEPRLDFNCKKSTPSSTDQAKSQGSRNPSPIDFTHRAERACDEIQNQVEKGIRDLWSVNAVSTEGTRNTTSSSRIATAPLSPRDPVSDVPLRPVANRTEPATVAFQPSNFQHCSTDSSNSSRIFRAPGIEAHQRLSQDLYPRPVDAHTTSAPSKSYWQAPFSTTTATYASAPLVQSSQCVRADRADGDYRGRAGASLIPDCSYPIWSLAYPIDLESSHRDHSTAAQAALSTWPSANDKLARTSDSQEGNHSASVNPDLHPCLSTPKQKPDSAKVDADERCLTLPATHYVHDQSHLFQEPPVIRRVRSPPIIAPFASWRTQPQSQKSNRTIWESSNDITSSLFHCLEPRETTSPPVLPPPSCFPPTRTVSVASADRPVDRSFSESIVWNEETRASSRGSTYDVERSSSGSSLPPSPPIIVNCRFGDDFQTHQQPTWSDPEQNIAFACRQPNVVKPARTYQQQSSFSGHHQLKIVLPTTGKLSSNGRSTDELTQSSSTLSSKSEKDQFVFEAIEEVRKRNLEANEESEHFLSCKVTLPEDDTIMGFKESCPPRKDECAEEITDILFRDHMIKEDNDECCSLSTTDTESMPPSPPCIIDFLPSFSPNYSPPVQPVARYSVPDARDQQTGHRGPPKNSSKPFIVPPFDLSSLIGSSSSDNGATGASSSDEESATCYSGSSTSNWSLIFLTDPESSRSSDCADPQDDVSKSPTPACTPSQSFGLYKRYSSPDVDTAIGRCISSPVDDDQPANKNPPDVSAFVVHKHDQSLLQPIHNNNAETFSYQLEQIRSTETLWRQEDDRRKECDVGDSINLHSLETKFFSQTTCSVMHHTQNFVAGSICLTNGFPSANNKLLPAEDDACAASGDPTSGRSTYVTGEASSEVPLPPSPPIIIDYLISADFEVRQQTWSDPEQNISYSTHRQPILKPTARRIPTHPAVLFGNRDRVPELPKLNVIRPTTGTLARASTDKGTAARNPMCYLNHWQMAQGEPCLDRSRLLQGLPLDVEESVGSAWRKLSHSNANCWTPDCWYQRENLKERNRPTPHLFHQVSGTDESRFSLLFGQSKDVVEQPLVWATTAAGYLHESRRHFAAVPSASQGTDHCPKDHFADVPAKTFGIHEGNPVFYQNSKGFMPSATNSIWHDPSPKTDFPPVFGQQHSAHALNTSQDQQPLSALFNFNRNVFPFDTQEETQTVETARNANLSQLWTEKNFAGETLQNNFAGETLQNNFAGETLLSWPEPDKDFNVRSVDDIPSGTPQSPFTHPHVTDWHTAPAVTATSSASCWTSKSLCPNKGVEEPVDVSRSTSDDGSSADEQGSFAPSGSSSSWSLEFLTDPETSDDHSVSSRSASNRDEATNELHSKMLNFAVDRGPSERCDSYLLVKPVCLNPPLSDSSESWLTRINNEFSNGEGQSATGVSAATPPGNAPIPWSQLPPLPVNVQAYSGWSVT